MNAQQMQRLVAALEKAATAFEKMAKIEAERLERDFPPRTNLDATISKAGQEEAPPDEGEPIATGRFAKLFYDTQKPGGP